MHNQLVPRGRFISVEGVDGAGKSTQLAFIDRWLTEARIAHIVTREPGGTPLGEKLRALLLNEPMHLETEALLMFASRREHLAGVIEPALQRGEWVLCDRFSDATYAYQGGGRGLPREKFEALERWVQDRGSEMIQPDLTFLFDVPPEVSQARMAGTRELDRFEREAASFHERVRNAYLERAHAAPARFRIINAARSIDAIQQELHVILSGWARETLA
ncbi:dTMP kinase [Silvimonas iriomotensis]|uniref:Thymidylate kinase n=1 Tax=Silvimonas iriomotensis TaxID=449662 RepID=A0ABQ2PBF4_9NEIS|nr:dTMP kinase [Silvimonas iriomotensis]GGP22857.1 thymidylate kinase [Silvimonas iriomotensis]